MEEKERKKNLIKVPNGVRMLTANYPAVLGNVDELV